MIHPFHQNNIMHISLVELLISDLDNAEAFYVDILGLTLIRRGSNFIELGPSSGEVLIKLIQTTNRIDQKITLGLYHFALLLSGKDHLASVLYRLSKHNYPITGLSDHGVSLALYLDDPDKNGIEIYVDRPKSMWPTSHDQIDMYTKTLDLEELMTHLPKEPYIKIDPNTIMGHLHFHIDDLDQAKKFYVDVLGFDVIQNYFNSALFVSAGKYHHHLGLNTWRKGAPLRQKQDIGLISYQLNIPKKEFIKLKERLSAMQIILSDDLSLMDPLGQIIKMNIYYKKKP